MENTPNNSVSNVWLIFLGSFLTFLATLIVELFKNYRENAKKSKNFKLIIKQELLAISKLLDKLTTVFEFRSYYDYAILDELKKAVEHLQAEGSQAIYLSNSVLQEKYLDLSSDLSSFIREVRSVQDVYYNQDKLIRDDEEALKKSKKAKRKSIFTSFKENIEAFNQKSVQKSISLVEINRRIDEFVKQIEK